MRTLFFLFSLCFWLFAGAQHYDYFTADDVGEFDHFARLTVGGNVVETPVPGSVQLERGMVQEASFFTNWNWAEQTALHAEVSLRRFSYFDQLREIPDKAVNYSAGVGFGANNRSSFFGTGRVFYNITRRSFDVSLRGEVYPWDIDNRIKAGGYGEFGSVEARYYASVGFTILLNFKYF